mgnify:CR=1 FL=1
MSELKDKWKGFAVGQYFSGDLEKENIIFDELMDGEGQRRMVELYTKEAVDFIASLAAVASSSGLDVEVVTTAGERASHGGGRSTAVLDLLALVERGASGVDTRLLRANRATTIVVRGQGVLGWWDRIPAVSVMRP